MDILVRVADQIRRFRANMDKSASVLLTMLQKPRFGPLFEGGDENDVEALSKWLKDQSTKTTALQNELDQLIYRYFDLNDQEIALVEETSDTFDRSDTPPSLEVAVDIPTLQPLSADALKSYADMLTQALNDWGTGMLRVSASGGVDGNLGLALVELNQTRSARDFKTRPVSSDLMSALGRLQKMSTERFASLSYLRGTWVFNGASISIVKPSLKGQWTRTAALNDAAGLYADIAEARRSFK
jgi:hypothetical protein